MVSEEHVERTKTVLVVDDQPDERTIQRAMLEHHGYRVVEACDGAEAIERVRDDEPDIVLLDVAMPGMDGFEVCRRIKSDATELPVLIFTASVVKELEADAKAAGADGVLEKPVDPHTVARRVAELIGASG